MAGFEDTFRPVNVGRPRGPLGAQEDVIGNAILDLGAASIVCSRL